MRIDKEKLLKKLGHISEILSSEYKNEASIGVLSGLSGMALFQYHYSKYIGNDLNNIGQDIIELAINKINKGYDYPTFCSGISGFGWALDYLERERFINIDCDEVLVEFDDYLYEMMILDMNTGYYDFLHGGIGHCFYFLNRYQNTKSQDLKKKYGKILDEFLSLLNRFAISDDKNKLKWSSLVHSELMGNKKVYDLGLSHGISSIIGILTKLYKIDVFKSKAEILLNGAIKYVLGYINKKNDTPFLFPKYISTGQSVNYQGRLAWCYSDLGIGIRLWQSAQVLSDKNLEKRAYLVLERITNNKSYEEHFIVDAGICHGSFGPALIFDKMYRNTNSSTFKEASEYWIEDGINKDVHTDGYAGYKHWNPALQEWKANATLLEGISGIGLTLLSYLSNSNLPWDECLMIN